MRTAYRDRVLRVLIILLCLDTVVSMVFSISGLLGPSGRRWIGPVDRGGVGLLWFALLGAVLLRALRHIRRLRGLLSTREEQIAAVEATTHDWLWETDAAFVARSCSAAITDLLGRAPSEVIGHTLFEFICEQDRPHAERTVSTAVRTGAGWQDAETRWLHSDGHPVTLIGSAVPVRDLRGQVVGFRGTRRSAPADIEARRRLSAISHRVAEALRPGALTMAAQPIVDLATGRCTGVEALARFADNRAPDVWFAEAHEAGCGVELELAAARAALALAPQLPPSWGLSLNASPALILDGRLRPLLESAALPLERLVIEITEHAAVSRYDDIQAALLPLRERGLALAIDDAGAGYASFTHVLQLRPDLIKVDRSLVTDIHRDPARRAFVTAVVLLALELGAIVTAEGVETAAELTTLEALGVDQAQGYFLARPSTEAERWHVWAQRCWTVTGERGQPSGEPGSAASRSAASA